MKRIKGSRPSPALVVAGAALVIALAGTAVADPLAVTSVLNKKEKKQVKKIANGQIKKLAKDLSVATAANATNAQNAANADNAARLNGLDPTQLSPSTGVNRTDDVTLTNNFDTVMTATITTAADSRLVANGALHLDSNAGGSRADCRFVFDGVAGIGYSSDIPINDETMPVVGTTTVAAGLHTVTLQCLKNVAGDVIVRNASMTVTAHLEG